MDPTRFGRALRAIRLATREGQRSVARRAGVSQTVYSRIERGRLASAKVSTLAKIASSLDADLVLDLRYQGGRVDRLIDRAHASIVEHVLRQLRSAGWEVAVEFSFNVFGERGSVDILGWHASTRTLLIVEVKSRLTDLQDLLLSLGRKLRLVPDLARRELGWDPISVARVLVVPGSSETRTILARHRAIFDSTLPSSTMAIRRWIRDPTGPIAGVWLVWRDAVNPNPTDQLPAESW
jgi:transcriptional regulator with XRE-family HTH domain